MKKRMSSYDFTALAPGLNTCIAFTCLQSAYKFPYCNRSHSHAIRAVSPKNAPFAGSSKEKNLRKSFFICAVPVQPAPNLHGNMGIDAFPAAILSAATKDLLSSNRRDQAEDMLSSCGIWDMQVSRPCSDNKNSPGLQQEQSPVRKVLDINLFPKSKASQRAPKISQAGKLPAFAAGDSPFLPRMS